MPEVLPYRISGEGTARAHVSFVAGGDRSTAYGAQKEGSAVLPRNKYTAIRDDKPKSKDEAKRPEFRVCKFTTDAIIAEGGDVGTIHKVCAKREYSCTPWGNPAYNVFGWQKPCYLLQDGYTETYAELLNSTNWDEYGTESGNPKCANCMVSCGYEPSAVDETFGSFRGLFAAARATLLAQYASKEAKRLLDEWPKKIPKQTLVEIQSKAR